jgi:hypothetical protein
VPVSFKPVKPLLQTSTHLGSRILSYLGLGIGVLLLLCSLQMFLNIQRLLGGNVIRKNGYDYVSITKKVTNETMGNPDKNLFHPNEIAELQKQPFISGVAPLIANEFHVQLSAAGLIKTDLFIETIENEFIDTVPPNFTWQPGQTTLPIIVGTDFLEVYNVFAPGQGLPQISPSSAMAIPVTITCFGKQKNEVFVGQIVAFSDRINSVLVPKTFLDWANQTLGDLPHTGAARLFIKTRDANDPKLLDFLDSRNYNVNKEKTKFGREKRIMQGILGGLSVFGILVVAMALMLFSFYLQLVIVRSRDSLQLLLLLGYSPTWLSRNVSRLFIPVYIIVVLLALIIVQLMQYLFHHFVMYDRPELDTLVDWSVVAVALALIILSIITSSRMVRRLLFRLY